MGVLSHWSEKGISILIQLVEDSFVHIADSGKSISILNEPFTDLSFVFLHPRGSI